MVMISQHHARTDGRSDGQLAVAIPRSVLCVASRGNKTRLVRCSVFYACNELLFDSLLFTYLL